MPGSGPIAGSGSADPRDKAANLKGTSSPNSTEPSSSGGASGRVSRQSSVDGDDRHGSATSTGSRYTLEKKPSLLNGEKAFTETRNDRRGAINHDELMKHLDILAYVQAEKEFQKKQKHHLNIHASMASHSHPGELVHHVRHHELDGYVHSDPHDAYAYRPYETVGAVNVVLPRHDYLDPKLKYAHTVEQR